MTTRSLLVLAGPRVGWTADVARWCQSSLVTADVVKCVSAADLRARLGAGRRWSGALLDGGLAAVDRALLAELTEAGCPALVVAAPSVRRDWAALGAAAVLSPPLDPSRLVDALDRHTSGHPSPILPPTQAPPAHDGGWQGTIVAVTGPGGTGTTVTAAALAQGLADEARNHGLVCLADLCRRADQAMVHDTGDVVPGLAELVDAHRGSAPSTADVRALTWAIPGRSHRVLLGLRHVRDWAQLRRASVNAALDSLTRSFRWVVADIDPDVDGEQETGSLDVEDRHLLSRATLERASVVAVTGRPDPLGIHGLTRLLADLVRVGVDPSRLQPVVVGVARSPRRRAEVVGALTQLCGDELSIAPPILVPAKPVDTAIRDAAPFPAAVVAPVARAVERLATERRTPARPEPTPVVPGSLGVARA